MDWINKWGLVGSVQDALSCAAALPVYAEHGGLGVFRVYRILIES
jgi:hypothetical protein